MAIRNVPKKYNTELKPFEWQNVDNKSHNPQFDGILLKTLSLRFRDRVFNLFEVLCSYYSSGLAGIQRITFTTLDGRPEHPGGLLPDKPFRSGPVYLTKGR